MVASGGLRGAFTGRREVVSRAVQSRSMLHQLSNARTQNQEANAKMALKCSIPVIISAPNSNINSHIKRLAQHDAKNRNRGWLLI